jgi:NTP pyrophosphatase (non-canonical NTP hydrolase)
MNAERERVVADRVPVDIEGLRERVAKAHAKNPLWEKLSLSQQLRALIEEALEVAESKDKGS